MVWLDLEGVGLGADGEEGGKGGKNKSLVEMALERGVRVMGGRLVVHYRTIFFSFPPPPSPLFFPKNTLTPQSQKSPP